MLHEVLDNVLVDREGSLQVLTKLSEVPVLVLQESDFERFFVVGIATGRIHGVVAAAYVQTVRHSRGLRLQPLLLVILMLLLLL